MHDWTILDYPEVTAIVEQEAERVAVKHGFEVEDMLQEAWVLVTDRHGGIPDKAHEGEWAFVRHALSRDLLNSTVTERKRRMVLANPSEDEEEPEYISRFESYDERYAEPASDDEAYAPVALVQRTDTNLYDRELVKSLLPAVWDTQFVWGMRVENAPDKDMPRSQSNKATGNTLAAHIVDIKRAWDGAILTKRERQCLLLTYGVDWGQKEAAAELGISQPAVSQFLLSGVGKLVAFLNRDDRLLASLEADLQAAA